MPFVSEAQRGYLYVHHPEIAKRWEEHTPKGKKLPKHVVKKEAEMPQIGFQQYAPLHARRALTDEEHRDIARGKSQWLPSIFQSYGTPVPMMMASPWKQGLLAALAGGGIGGLAGANIGSAMKTPKATGIGALLGALGVGGTAGLVTGLSRNAKNEGLVELMKRLPPNAVKRDLLADPAYQKDVQRDSDSGNVMQLLNGLRPDNLMQGLPTVNKFSSDKQAGVVDTFQNILQRIKQWAGESAEADEHQRMSRAGYVHIPENHMNDAHLALRARQRARSGQTGWQPGDPFDSDNPTFKPTMTQQYLNDNANAQLPYWKKGPGAMDAKPAPLPHSTCPSKPNYAGNMKASSDRLLAFVKAAAGG